MGWGGSEKRRKQKEKTMLKRPFLSYVPAIFFIVLSVCSFAVGIATEKLAEQSFEQLLKLAEAGDAQAQYDLAIIYSKSKNDEKTVKWLTKAADQGHITARLHLGKAFYNGWFNLPTDYDKAFKWYTAAAEQGDPDVQNQVGNEYAFGNADEARDWDKAFFWFKKAAEQGSGAGMRNLGFLYSFSRKPEDKKKSIEWYTLAADQGHADRTFVKMLNGRHDQDLLFRIAVKTPADLDDAGKDAVYKISDQKLLEKIAFEAKSKGARQAAIEKLENRDILVQLENQGNFTARSRREYLDKLARARSGDAETLFELAQKPSTKLSQKISWLTTAAEQGHVKAQYQLGHIYTTEYGRMLVALAIKWHMMAAEQGYVESQYELGEIYRIGGSGVDEDIEKARKWYTLAASNGHELKSYEINILTDQNLLIKIANSSKRKDSRKAALKKVTDQEALEYFALASDYFDLRIVAIEKLSNDSLLKDLASTDPAAQIRLVAVKQIVDDNFLFERNRQDSSAEVRFQAVDQIKSQELLAMIASRSYYQELRELAKSKVTEPSLKVAINLADESLAELLKKIESSDDLDFLVEMAIEGDLDVICIDAVKKLSDPTSLATVAAKSKDRQVTKIAILKFNDKETLSKVISDAIDPAVKIAAEIKFGSRTWESAFKAATQPGAEKQDLGNVLAAVSLLPIQYGINSLVTEACLTMIRQGDESRIPELVDLLHVYGYKELCEDYLNCGQPDLDTAGRDWASNHGYNIGTGNGSARARWGHKL